MTQSHVRFDVRNNIGHIVLDRERALNALDLRMIREIQARMNDWSADENILAVVLRSSFERAFCAGGDVRSLVVDYRDGGREYQTYFREEYDLDLFIYNFPKPVVAVMDGVTMGGGIGLARGAEFRLATERSRFAMPETRIGFFPDVGATHFLSHMPGGLGLYLGLTGAELAGEDALFCGLANRIISADTIPALLQGLDEFKWTGNAHGDIALLLASLGARHVPNSAPVEDLTAPIDTHFLRPDVVEILRSLENENRPEYCDWAKVCLNRLSANSPLAMVTTKALWARGSTLSLEQCFDLEYHLTRQWFDRGEIVEGVRALLIDKDKCPHWNPPTLPQVSNSAVESFFDGYPDP